MPGGSACKLIVGALGVRPELFMILLITFSQSTMGLLTTSPASNGKLFASQASIPPSSGRTLVIPFALSSSATRALVASLGHEQ
jgi:hypothetical protein